MVLFESYPAAAAYQQQTYTMIRESDGYGHGGLYNGSSAMPMGQAQWNRNYPPQPQMGFFQQGHTDQKLIKSEWGHADQQHQSGLVHAEQKHQSGWGHAEQKHQSGWGHTDHQSGWSHADQRHQFGRETSAGYGNDYSGNGWGNGQWW